MKFMQRVHASPAMERRAMAGWLLPVALYS